MSTLDSGRQAEATAVNFLQQRHFKLQQQNWRTRYCEIDIVAQKKQRMYFIEVKFRARPLQGNGLDYITSAKLRQMAFAAELWVQEHGWSGEYCLGAIEVSGTNFTVTAFVPDCL